MGEQKETNSLRGAVKREALKARGDTKQEYRRNLKTLVPITTTNTKYNPTPGQIKINPYIMNLFNSIFNILHNMYDLPAKYYKANKTKQNKKTV